MLGTSNNQMRVYKAITRCQQDRSRWAHSLKEFFGYSRPANVEANSIITGRSKDVEGDQGAVTTSKHRCINLPTGPSLSFEDRRPFTVFSTLLFPPLFLLDAIFTPLFTSRFCHLSHTCLPGNELNPAPAKHGSQQLVASIQ